MRQRNQVSAMLHIVSPRIHTPKNEARLAERPPWRPGSRQRNKAGILPLFCIALLSAPWLMGEASCPTEDADGDGYPFEQDCDDTDASIYPGAPEQCNGLDDNCDGAIDEGLLVAWHADKDVDGYGNDAEELWACDQPAGASAKGGDCDDRDASRHPQVIESCNGLDDDCDGVHEELPQTAGLVPTYHRDLDGDGFGASSDIRCDAMAGYVVRRGDCADDDASVHPGASDPDGDGIDRDCGGHDGPDPHVGLSAESQASVASALSMARDGTILWIGPGAWRVRNQSLPSLNLRIFSTDQAAGTSLSAEDDGRIFSLSGSSGLVRELDGFTLQDGWVASHTGYGGAIYLTQTRLTMRGCHIRRNAAIPVASSYPEAAGAGIYADRTTLTLRGSVIEGNAAYSYGPYTYYQCSFCSETGSCSAWDEYGIGSGGGLATTEATVYLMQTRFLDNIANVGGGIYANSSTLYVSDVEFSGNQAVEFGYCGWSSSGSCQLSCKSYSVGGIGDDYWLDNSTLEPY